MTCPNCGNFCPDQHRFCGNCGAPLASEIVSSRTGPAHPYEVSAPVSYSGDVPLQSKYADMERPYKKHRLLPLLIPLCILGVLILAGSAMMLLHYIGVEFPKTYKEGCFSITNGILCFDPSAYSEGASLTVPRTVGGQEVVGISEGCFSGCTELEEIILPDSITFIEDRAFDGCTSLRGIALPASLQTLGMGAFSRCGKLEAIYIPETVTSIGENCFSECDRLHFIFYDGIFQDWQQLYPGFISYFTFISCSDGIFSQAAS